MKTTTILALAATALLQAHASPIQPPAAALSDTLTSSTLLATRSYTPGWCGVHVTQFQKPNPARDSYSLAATVKDAAGAVVGSTGKVGPSVGVGSQLPFVLQIFTGGVDADPVRFAYAGQNWDSNDRSRCSVGRYDSGKREMDCGFSC